MTGLRKSLKEKAEAEAFAAPALVQVVPVQPVQPAQPLQTVGTPVLAPAPVIGPAAPLAPVVSAAVPDGLLTVQARSGGWFDVVDSGRQVVNEKPLRKAEAEAMVSDG